MVNMAVSGAMTAVDMLKADRGIGDAIRDTLQPAIISEAVGILAEIVKIVLGFFIIIKLDDWVFEKAGLTGERSAAGSNFDAFHGHLSKHFTPIK
jgi:hypothetical protein